jgi:signal transduction histidine kinase/PAS domain-containing protein
MAELSVETLARFKEVLPGNSAVYVWDGHHFTLLFHAAKIPLFLGIEEKQYCQRSESDALSLVLDSDRPLAEQALSDCLKSHACLSLSFRVERKGRGIAWVHAQGGYVGEFKGNPVYFISYTSPDSEKDIYQEILSHTDRLIYVSDAKTNEILYINQPDSFLKKGKTLGMPCHEFIFDRSSPCEGCYIPQLRQGEKVDIKRFNPYNNHFEHVTAEPLLYCGREAFVHYVEDITESHALHEEVKATEKRYQSAVEGAGLVVWEYHIKEKKITNISSGMRKVGLPETLTNVPESLLGYCLEDDQVRFLNLFKRIAEGKEEQINENFWMKWKEDIAPRYEHIVLSIVKDSNGVPSVAYGIGMDITSHAEERERYLFARRQLEESHPASLATFHINLTKNESGQGRYVMSFVSKAEEKGTADGFLDVFASMIADPEIQKVAAERFSRSALLSAFERGQTSELLQYPIIYPDGNRHWREAQLYLIKNPISGDVEALCYAIDIDKRKQTEFLSNALQKDSFGFLLLIDVATGMIISGGDTKKGSAERYSNENYSEALEKALTHFFKNDQREEMTWLYSLSNIKKELQSKPIFQNTAKGVDGHYYHWRFSYVDEAKSIILMTRSDVTESMEKELKQAEDLRKAVTAAEQANEAKSEFLSRMSHDMRTPLNGIIGMSYLTENMDLPKEAKENLKKIDTSSKFLLSLINDLLDMAKAESGKITLHPEPYSINDFLTYIGAVIKPLCDEKSQKLVIDAAPVPGVVPLMDELRTNQIYFNLFSNAVKYTPENGTITYKLRGHMTPDNRLFMEITISDTGIGMSEEFQKHLFEPFAQEHRTDYSEMRGTGLGLAIVKRLVDLMKGSIRVESVLGKGSSFILDFTFDIVKQTSKPTALEAVASPSDYSSISGKHVLVCEDHPLNQEIVKKLLEKKNAIVEIAENGEIGVQDFLRSRLHYYDVILMDIHMPIMNGYEATRKIRALKRADAKDTPIIALTADAYDSDVKACLDAGMNSHLAKPLDPLKLYETLSQLFQKEPRS